MGTYFSWYKALRVVHGRVAYEPGLLHRPCHGIALLPMDVAIVGRAGAGHVFVGISLKRVLVDKIVGLLIRQGQGRAGLSSAFVMHSAAKWNE